MKWATLIFLACSYVLHTAVVYALPPLQLYIELTPEQGVLRLPAGHYAGPAVITKPITIEAEEGEVVIDGEGSGTVLSIQSDNVVIRGLHITGSGESFDRVDAGIFLEADKVIIENTTIDNVLFGINFKSANENIVRNNTISSKPVKAAMRGDGVRLWNSFDNLIENNKIESVRDVYITNSSDNRFINNHISKSKIGFQLVFSHDNEISGNTITNNGTGILLFYSNNLLIKENRISHLRSLSGAALAFKESNGVVVRDNEILHCANGLTANSPVHPENILNLLNNQFTYNDVALYFYGAKGGHIIEGNRFEQNIVDVRVSAVATTSGNLWKNNYWDTYRGFDLDNDGIGDTPYELYLYSDRIWMDRPTTQFFRGALAMEFIDFVERLTSYSEPNIILKDAQPKVN